MTRQEIINLIHNEYDPRPDLGHGDYRAFEWDDGSGRIADAVMARIEQLEAALVQSGDAFMEQAHRDNNWIGLSASEKAAYDWPDDSDLHRQCRAAYVAGATDYARIPGPAQVDTPALTRRIEQLEAALRAVEKWADSHRQLVPSDIARAALFNLCEDEGCPNAGTPHVCINRQENDDVYPGFRGNNEA